MGIDPDTSIIPDTKETLAIRRQRDAEERQESINRANRRARNTASAQKSPAPMPPPSLPQVQTPNTQSTVSKTPTPAPPEDDFLKQIREAREAMAEQTEWFKQQSVTLEQEVEQEEEFRKSQSNRDAGSPHSSSGLARVNGYEYLPAETNIDVNLSRTEQRIRRTGAHGLATKPLRSRSDYVAVAMSKRTALDYNSGSHSSPGRKRSHDDFEPPSNIKAAARSADALHASKRLRAAPHPPAATKVTHQQPRPSGRNGNQNPYQLLQGDRDEAEEDSEEDDHDTDELFDDDDEEEELLGLYPTYDVRNGNYADDEDEEDLEEDDENDYHSGTGPAEEYEDDGEELDEDSQQYQYPTSYLQAGQDEYEDAATPVTNPQVSRAASSAPGNSADDAFVIDDSD